MNPSTQIQQRAVTPGAMQLASYTDAQGRPVTQMVKVTQNGTVQAIQSTVSLSIARGEIYMMRGNVGGQWVDKPSMTALAYDKMNQFAGVSIHQPDTLMMDDGAIRPNPYLHFDEHHNLMFVKIRLMGLWRNNVGNLVLRDNTLQYDVQTYLARDAWSKWTGKKSESVKDWGKSFPIGQVPDEYAADPRWLKIKAPIGVVLCCDMQHKDVISLLGEQLQRVTFAERIAQTICRRNLLKQFFGVVSPAQHGNQYSVSVVSWSMPDRNLSQMADAVRNVREGKIVMDGEVVEVQATESQTVSDPDEINVDADIELGEDAPVSDDADDVAAPQSVAPETPPTSGANPAQAILADQRKHLRELAKSAGGPATIRALKKQGFESMKQAVDCDSIDALAAVIADLQTSIDAENQPKSGEMF